MSIVLSLAAESALNANVITIILAVIGATGASFVTGLFMRPKVSAEVRASNATGDVAISGDAREWAKVFSDRTDKAEQRADQAEQDAAEAQMEARETARRCDILERKVTDLIGYTLSLQREMQAAGLTPPEPPPGLRPPL